MYIDRPYYVVAQSKKENDDLGTRAFAVFRPVGCAMCADGHRWATITSNVIL